jgi:DNA-binding NarL/FixJ family response regulator
MPETAEMAIHILLLDDHALFRESVGRLLAAEPGFDVAAYCGTIK